MLDLHALARGSDAGAHVGSAIDIDEAVGALARHTEQAARPVIFEAAGEDTAAGAEERRSHGVALTRLDRLAVKLKRKIRGAVGHYCGKNASKTSLVVVLRRACNHWRQPERWYHHSFWTPDSFVLVYVYSIQSAAGASGAGRCFTSPPKRNS